MTWTLKRPPSAAFFSVPELVARKRGAELERFNARVKALAERDTLDLRASVGTCADPAMLWSLHMELMGRGLPPILRGQRPWHLGTQGRLVEFAADVAWLQATEPGHRGRYGLARAILKPPWGSDGWWRLVLRQFGRSGDVRGLVLAFGLTEPQRFHLRTVQTAPRAQIFERLHGDGFGKLVGVIEDAVRAAPDLSGRTDPRATAIRRAQLWRVHRLLDEGPARTAYSWARLSGEELNRWQVAKQLAAVKDVALAFERFRVDAEALE